MTERETLIELRAAEAAFDKALAETPAAPRVLADLRIDTKGLYAAPPAPADVAGLTVNLYQQMPGAEMPPFEAGRGYLWGEVESTPEWAFCEMVAKSMAALAASEKPASGEGDA